MIERRQFLKTLGLTGSAVALEHCAPAPTDTLVPYLISPDNVTPGVATYYATTCRECPAGCGLHVKVMNGRIIKAEGNPHHPISRGHLCARGQATVQSLYNPDRFGMPRRRDGNGDLLQIAWEEAEGLLVSQLRDAMNRGRDRVAWIGGLTTGSFEQLTTDWLQALGSGRRLVYEPFDYEPLRAASELVFGRAEVPRHDFDRAQYVLAFGAEFLETWISNVEFASAYAALRRRKVRDPDGSFTWVAPRLSLTGLNSDAWVPVRPGAEVTVALSIAHAVIDADLSHPPASLSLPSLRDALAPFAAERAQSITGVAPAAIQTIARRFASASPSIAVGGGIAGIGEHHAIELEVAALLLNVLVGNIGQTVSYGAGSALDRIARRSELVELTDAMTAGQIDVLLVHGSNPILTLPQSVAFAKALSRVPFVVTFSGVRDETTDRAHLVLPDHHFLESWGDYSPRSGVTGLLQPAAAPMLHSRPTGDVLLSVARKAGVTIGNSGEAGTWADYVKNHVLGRLKTASTSQADRTDSFDLEQRWNEDVRAGGRFEETQPQVDVAVRDVSPVLARVLTTASANGITLVAYPSSHSYDGRSANESWSREVPDPVTAIAWTDWMEVHPETARSLGVRDGDTVIIESDHGQVEAACHVSNGIHPSVVAMPMGLRRGTGRRDARDRGANVLDVLPPHAADGMHAAWSVGGVRLRRGQQRRVVIPLQAADPNATAVEPFARVIDPSRVDAAGPPTPPPTSLYPPHAHREHRWGMAIDLNVCTGCNACVVACYAENNVPVVGEQACAMGREMSWIRIERDHRVGVTANGAARVENVFLPMLCQQCDQAPCESVCPVYATYHNPEGLNAQVYARCIGTRFCSNNCPYKVRRFNWSQPAFPSPLNLQLNPDVTVRSSGVMEKCTFCIQRIQAGKQQARREHRQLRDGDITPACAQTCPADAIVFGDLVDPESRVSKLSADRRGYHVLEQLNTRPAITYLRRSVPGAGEE